MRSLARTSALLVLIAGGCAKPAPAPDPQFVAQWMRSSLSFVRSERLGPPVAARISAYASVALYEGYAADPASRLVSLGGQLNGLSALPKSDKPVDGAIVAAEAERLVMDSLFRDGFASTRRTIDSLAKAQAAARVAVGVSAAVHDASLAHGAALGAAILAWAAKDGFFEQLTKQWTPPTRRDKWVNTATTDQYIPLMISGETDLVRPTNPNASMELERAGERFVFTNRPKAAKPTTLPVFNPVKPTAPYWGDLRPFVIANGDECAPPPPPAYSETPGSPFWKMAKEYYDSVKVLTPDKKQIALFWADNPAATGTPGFHWVSVLNQMVARRHLSADQAAEAYALMSMSIADAFIGCWKEKYRSLVVRPVTYVQRVFDKKFETAFPTPPFPEYTSGHSVQSGAAVLVLEHFLGDTISFVDSTQVDIGQPPRAFTSFRAARDEVAVSRLYGGVHYLPAIMDGLTQGTCVGERVLTLKTRAPK
jgi:hypothetical protein